MGKASVLGHAGYQDALVAQFAGVEHAPRPGKHALGGGMAGLDIRQWGIALFQYVYSDVTAVAYMKRDNGLISFLLLDTDFGQEALDIPPPAETAQIAVVSNHSTGNTMLSQGDLRNISILGKRNLPLRVYLVCEARCIQVA